MALSNALRLGLWVALLGLPLVAQVKPPDRFSVVLWASDAAHGIASAKQLGADALQLGRGADPSALREAGLGYYLDQPIGKGLFELRDATWQALAHAFEQQRDAAQLVRPTCLGDAELLRSAAAQAAAELQRVAGAGLRFVALADEPSATRHDAPLDVCGCAACGQRFAQFAQQQWGDLAAINAALGTAYRTLDEVRPLSTDQVRLRELNDPLLPADLRPFRLRQEFVSKQYRDALALVLGAMQQAAPAVPIGLTGLSAPAAFGGNDPARLLPQLTAVEAYAVGGAMDLATAFAPRAHRYSTLFAPEPAAKGPSLRQRVRMALSQAACRGQAGIVLWNDAAVCDAASNLTAFGTACRDELAALRATLQACAGAQVEPSALWLLESQASVDLWWMLDSAADGKTWNRRLASYEAEHSTSQAARLSWLQLLRDLGLQPRLVAEADLTERLLREAPRCLVLPATLALSARSAQAIAAYVHSGGTLLADHSTALYDEFGLRRERGAMDELFGIRGRSLRWQDLLVRQGRALSQETSKLPAAELGLQAALGEQREQTMVFAEQSAGRGRAVYLNAPVCRYGVARADTAQVAFAYALRQRVRGILQRAGLEPVCDVRGTGLPTCIERTALRLRDGRAVLAVRINLNDHPELLARIGGGDLPRVQIEFPRQRDARLLVGGSVASSRSFDVALDPFGAVFLELLDR